MFATVCNDDVIQIVNYILKVGNENRVTQKYFWNAYFFPELVSGTKVMICMVPWIDAKWSSLLLL